MTYRTIIEVDHQRRAVDGDVTLDELRALAENANVQCQLLDGEAMELCAGVRAVGLRKDGEGLTVRCRRGALVRQHTEPESPLDAHVRAQSGEWDER